MEYKHKPGRIVLVVTTAAVFAVVVLSFLPVTMRGMRHHHHHHRHHQLQHEETHEQNVQEKHVQEEPKQPESPQEHHKHHGWPHHKSKGHHGWPHHKPKGHHGWPHHKPRSHHHGKLWWRKKCKKQHRGRRSAHHDLHNMRQMRQRLEWCSMAWMIVYGWQMIWVVYSLVNICRRTKAGYMYITPEITPAWFLFSFMLTMILNASVIAFRDQALRRDRPVLHIPALALSYLMQVTLLIALIFLYSKKSNTVSTLRELRKTKDIWFMRTFLDNGIALFFIFMVIGNVFGLFHVVSEQVGSWHTASIAAGVWFVTQLVAYGILDNIFHKVTRYTFSPYFVVMAAALMTMKHHRSSCTIGLTILALALFLIKVLVLVVVSCRGRQLTSGRQLSVEGGETDGEYPSKDSLSSPPPSYSTVDLSEQEKIPL